MTLILRPLSCWSVIVPAKSFNAVGGFDIGWTQAAGEDRDLCDRLVAHGCRLVFVADALVQHAHCLSFLPFASSTSATAGAHTAFIGYKHSGARDRFNSNRLRFI
jgi:GT2 family glycosyltransferase